MKKWQKAMALVIALFVSFGMISVTAYATGKERSRSVNGVSIHPNIDISEITGEGGDPEEITGEASAYGAEKEWYEYIAYNTQPVASYRLSDSRRLVFYEPYNYSEAMIMEVTGADSDWSTANSITVSITKGNSLNWGESSSETTQTSIQKQEGRDESHGFTAGISTSITAGLSTTVSEKASATVGAKVGAKTGVNTGIASAEVSAEESVSATVEAGLSVTGKLDTSIGETASTTEGWSTLANRVTTATGSSTSTNRSWSTSDSKTVTRTFNATYFNSSGSPLNWQIVQYTVYMPMKCDLQCYISGEWVTTDSTHVLLTTMEGTCRRWMQDDVVYIEHFGNGEKVTENKFWSSFFTKDNLINAYNNKLYPNDN